MARKVPKLQLTGNAAEDAVREAQRESMVEIIQAMFTRPDTIIPLHSNLKKLMRVVEPRPDHFANHKPSAIGPLGTETVPFQTGACGATESPIQCASSVEPSKQSERVPMF